MNKYSSLRIIIYKDIFSEEHLHGMGVRVVTVSFYLGDFICGQDSYKVWSADKVMRWTDSVKVLAGVVHRHPYRTYTSAILYSASPCK